MGVIAEGNEPSQSMIKRKYMIYWLKTVEKYGKPIKKVPVTLVTIEGLAYLKRIIHKKLKRKKNDRNTEEARLCDDGRGNTKLEN
jgi:hypothetical protein